MDAASKLGLYPLIEPYHVGELAVSELHTVYYEISGNPDGLPVVFVHGGPGGGTEPSHRRFFDPSGMFFSVFFRVGDRRSAFSERTMPSAG